MLLFCLSTEGTGSRPSRICRNGRQSPCAAALARTCGQGGRLSLWLLPDPPKHRGFSFDRRAHLRAAEVPLSLSVTTIRRRNSVIRHAAARPCHRRSSMKPISKRKCGSLYQPSPLSRSTSGRWSRFNRNSVNHMLSPSVRRTRHSTGPASQLTRLEGDAGEPSRKSRTDFGAI
jgi:hypothetical protein